ncbi:hypothetical protein STANM309S_02975 [Streptomyces tanashiensis]
MGESDRALTILQDIQHLRAGNGMYWTGYVFEGETEADRAVWPEEQTAWTAGSLLLAVAALGGEEATVAVFAGDRLRRVSNRTAAADPAGQALGNEIRIR